MGDLDRVEGLLHQFNPVEIHDETIEASASAVQWGKPDTPPKAQSANR